MRKSSCMLIDDHRIASNLASLSLFLLVAAFVLILVNEHTFKVPAVQEVMAFVFGGVMLSSLASMIAATYHVVRQRMELSDPYMFLTIAWLLPYLGISILLGWPNFRRIFGRI